MIKENVYGHAKRLRWVESHAHKQDTLIELGCGTGYMITLPLAKQGFSIRGFDFDEKSIEYGKNIFKSEGLDDSHLSSSDITSLNISGDIIILSEVIEHLKDDEIKKLLLNIQSRLKENGRLLITVPNGYGWFEFESFIWNKMRMGRFLEAIGIVEIILQIKKLFWGNAMRQPPHPSTLSDSPHIQRFTLPGIKKILMNRGFEIIETTGSVLFAGPFSNLLFHGVKTFMRLNCLLGGLLPSRAAGFYIACRLPKPNEK